MSAIKTVALAGASGAMGEPILKALIDAKFDVTVFTRPSSTHTFPSSVKVIKVDYSDLDSVKSALKGQDALISTLAAAALKDQELLVDAAIAAGVKRFIPSEFGSDSEIPAVRKMPVFAPKVQVQEYLLKTTPGTSLTYTLVFNNAFFDWMLDMKFGLDIKGKKAQIFDGGDKVWTTTPLDFIAKGVVGVLQHPDETANRIVRLHGTAMTQNKLLGLAQRFAGEDGWEVTQLDSVEAEKQSYENLKNDPSNIHGWMFGFLQRTIWGKGTGGDFSNNNDNEVLGLKELSEKEVEDIVRARA